METSPEYQISATPPFPISAIKGFAAKCNNIDRAGDARFTAANSSRLICIPRQTKGNFRERVETMFIQIENLLSQSGQLSAYAQDRLNCHVKLMRNNLEVIEEQVDWGLLDDENERDLNAELLTELENIAPPLLEEVYE